MWGIGRRAWEKKYDPSHGLRPFVGAELNPLGTLTACKMRKAGSRNLLLYSWSAPIVVWWQSSGAMDHRVVPPQYWMRYYGPGKVQARLSRICIQTA